MTHHACSAPLTYERFLEYWFGELVPSEEEATELALAGCSRCGELAQTWALDTQSLGETLALLPRAFLNPNELAALGTRAEIVDVPHGGECSIAVKRDVVHVFRVTLERELVSQFDRVDVEYSMPGVPEPTFHASDVARSNESGVVHLACHGHVLGKHGNLATLRLVGTRQGEARTLVESVIRLS